MCEGSRLGSTIAVDGPRTTMASRHLFSAAYLAIAVTAVTVPACWICDDERALITACDRIREAVHEVELACELPPTSQLVICGAVCEDYGSCPDAAEVAACTDAIRTLGCDAIGVRTSYADLPACAEIFTEMASSCRRSSGSFDDDD